MTAYSIVGMFERRVAEFAGAPYAVAVDSCTNALFLALRFLRDRNKSLPLLSIPARTYCSVPMAATQAGYPIIFERREWRGVYDLKPLAVRDGAKRFRRGMYEYGYHCLSFHVKKLIPIGRGGMILHSDPEFDVWARQARHNGRVDGSSDRRAVMIGFDCYMTPMDAARGLMLMDVMPVNGFDDQTEDYPDLRDQPALNKVDTVRHPDAPEAT